jgi:hypothetical protein
MAYPDNPEVASSYSFQIYGVKAANGKMLIKVRRVRKVYELRYEIFVLTPNFQGLSVCER